MFKFLDDLNQKWAVNCYVSANTKRELPPSIQAEKERLLAEQAARLKKERNQ